MTSYCYQLTLNDSEAMAVEEALVRYAHICETELAAGPKAPYWAHLQSLYRVLSRLSEGRHLRSSNNFARP